MAKNYNIAYEVATALNAESNGDFEVDVSERRYSLSDLKSKGILDYAKLSLEGGKVVLRAFLVKNFTDLPEDEWKKRINKLGSTLSSKLKGKEDGTRYSWSKGKYLGLEELSADIHNQWAGTEGGQNPAMAIALQDADTSGIVKLLDLKDDNDPSVEEGARRAQEFLAYVGAKESVMVPKRLWRDSGFSSEAINMGIRVRYPEDRATVLAIHREEFDKVAGKMGYTVTTKASDAPLQKKALVATRGKQTSGGESRINLELVTKQYIDALEATPGYQYLDSFNDIDKAMASYEQRVEKGADLTDDEMDHLAELTQAKSDKNLLATKLAERKRIMDEIREPYDDKIRELTEATSTSIESGTAASGKAAERRDTIQDNAEIIQKKVILLRKAPKHDYYTLASFAGTKLPIY